MKDFYRLAKRFAVFTLFTAYVGKQVNDRTSHGLPITNGGGPLGLGLYEYFLPSPSALFSSSKSLVYLVLLCYAFNLCWKALQHQVSRFQRSTSAALQSVASTEALSRIRSTVSTTFLRRSSRGGPYNSEEQKEGRSLVLSNPEPFVSPEVMERMTLRDMAHVYQYAASLNQKGFERAKFLKSVRTAAKQAIGAVDAATARSRGEGVKMINNGDDTTIDALAFCAATRIFCEWRNIRAVPDGYPGYAFGMSLARRDLVQNIRKVEQAVHRWLDFHHQKAEEHAASNAKHSALHSPTLRELLQHEIDINLHPKRPYLKEQSAASGVLWINRQVRYQSYAMDNNARVPVDFPNPKAAFSAAYEAVYKKYHGFLVRTVFQNTFDSAPPAKEVLRYMNMPYLDDVPTLPSANTEGNHQHDEEEEETWVQLPLDDDDDEVVEQTATTGISIATSMSSAESSLDEPHVDLGEKLVQIFTSVFARCVVHPEAELRKSRNALASFHSHHHHPSSKALLAASSSARSRISLIMEQQNDVPFYLSVLTPLEEGIGRLIDNLNLNDPSRA